MLWGGPDEVPWSRLPNLELGIVAVGSGVVKFGGIETIIPRGEDAGWRLVVAVSGSWDRGLTVMIEEDIAKEKEVTVVLRCICVSGILRMLVLVL